MRGKRAFCALGQGRAGLIPAYAGKTLGPSSAARWLSAHPRVCGENRMNVLGGVSVLGSSPRMRGKLRLGLPVVAMNRLIPAYAGKTPDPAGHD